MNWKNAKDGVKVFAMYGGVMLVIIFFADMFGDWLRSNKGDCYDAPEGPYMTTIEIIHGRPYACVYHPAALKCRAMEACD